MSSMYACMCVDATELTCTHVLYVYDMHVCECDIENMCHVAHAHTYIHTYTCVMFF
jgi:hypothetical protein